MFINIRVTPLWRNWEVFDCASARFADKQYFVARL